MIPIACASTQNIARSSQTNMLEFIFSFSKVLELKQQVEQKHLHLLQVLDSERQAKWYYVQQTEEFASEVANLEREVNYYLLLQLANYY